MKKELYETMKKQALSYYDKARIVLTEKECQDIEVADFGLADVEKVGLMLVTFVNTKRCCAKEMVLLPGQTCPEHAHMPIPELDYPGKEETFRCRYGTVYLYVDGTETSGNKNRVPAGYEDTYTVFHEIVLNAGEQYTLDPGTKHWFQGGTLGAVISEFSTSSYDAYDIFTDARIDRLPKVE